MFIRHWWLARLRGLWIEKGAIGRYQIYMQVLICFRAWSLEMRDWSFVDGCQRAGSLLTMHCLIKYTVRISAMQIRI